MTLMIKAEKREIKGKKLAEYRLAGKLPVVIYGPKEKPVNFFIDRAEFEKVFRQAGESTVITVETPDGKKDVLVHDVTYHHVADQIIHVDFYAIEKDKKVEVGIPLSFVGESPAVKGLGGNLVKVLHEITVSALPKDLPHELEVDITSLVDFDSQIQLKDIKLPVGVEAVGEVDEVVALVEVAREEEAEEEVETTPDFDAIKVEKKGKKEEEEVEE